MDTGDDFNQLALNMTQTLKKAVGKAVVRYRDLNFDWHEETLDNTGLDCRPHLSA